MRRGPVRALAVVLALTAGACSNSKNHDNASTASDTTTSSQAASSTTSSTPTTSASTTTACAGIVAKGVASVDQGAHATLVDVRIGQQPCSDRVVFEFREQNPSLHYSVEPASPPFTQDGSGKTVTVQGRKFLRVKFTDASGFDFQTGKPSYTGPESVKGTRRVAEARRTGDFEGVLTWIVGLQADFPYHIQVLGSPERLVIDFGGG